MHSAYSSGFEAKALYWLFAKQSLIEEFESAGLAGVSTRQAALKLLFYCCQQTDATKYL
ncbi:MAG: hypothetical protein ACJA2Q_002168 [Pseudohongiellaceae bacterium]|jgi:hypothetical protein